LDGTEELAVDASRAEPVKRQPEATPASPSTPIPRRAGLNLVSPETKAQKLILSGSNGYSQPFTRGKKAGGQARKAGANAQGEPQQEEKP